ncbi:lipocalin family protein [Hymenobacter sp. NST-14]|uniref:lipocalin family protein n=1 Tax=Hymenobacter piscis TaxID=2839984 RepID=UPI001C0176F8|nr:lipocalin family protein [Hymenobacter piscis]MBT9393093.1 lipocalin family protein [Hymenobacter piscis]
MKRISFLALAVAASSAFVGCSSDNKSEDPTPKTKAEMLAAHDWIMTGAEVTVSGQTVDAYQVGMFEDCEKDDFYHFVNTSNGGTYTLNENTNVCSPSGAEAGTWALNSDQTKLTLTAQGSQAEESTITELTDSSLKVTGTVDFLGTPLTMTLSFKAK